MCLSKKPNVSEAFFGVEMAQSHLSRECPRKTSVSLLGPQDVSKERLM